MSMDRDSGLPVHAQIANLEFRLAALRQQQESLRRGGRVMKWGAWITWVCAAVFVTVMAFTMKSDPVPMIFISTILLAGSAGLLWINRHETWIADFRSHVLPVNRYTSTWIFLEENIKEGEQQLAALKSLPEARFDPPRTP